jgi:hypothetical protein
LQFVCESICEYQKNGYCDFSASFDPRFESSAACRVALRKNRLALLKTTMLSLLFGKRCFAARARSLSLAHTQRRVIFIAFRGRKVHNTICSLSAVAHSFCAARTVSLQAAARVKFMKPMKKKGHQPVSVWFIFPSCDGLIERKMRRLEYEFGLIDVNVPAVELMAGAAAYSLF